MFAPPDEGIDFSRKWATEITKGRDLVLSHGAKRQGVETSTFPS